MQFLQFASVVIISCLGLPAGFFLSSLTREELPTARRYFPVLERIAIFAIAAVLMEFFGVAAPVKVIAYFALFAVLMVKISLPATYAGLGAAVASVANDLNALLIVSSLVFLFGLLSGSDYFAGIKKKQNALPGAVRLLLLGSPYFIAAAAGFAF